MRARLVFCQPSYISYSRYLKKNLVESFSVPPFVLFKGRLCVDKVVPRFDI